MGKEDLEINTSQTTSPNPFPTPTSSATGPTFSMTDSRPDTAPSSAMDDVIMTDAPSSHTRTDHDRINTPLEQAGVGGPLDLGYGSLLKLLETPLSIPSVHPTEDIFKRFGLVDIAKSVARRDPVTGEKINKLRKSYDNQIKELKIAGEKNKSISKPGELLQNILEVPEDKWRSGYRDIPSAEALQSEEMKAKLSRALQLVPGKLVPKRGEKKDSDIVYRCRTMVGDGMDKAKAAAINGAPKPQVAQPGKAGRGLISSAAPSPALKATARPARAGAKRSYDDAAFKGYGEGYADDGESTGAEDGRAGSAKKKPRKDFGPGTPLGGFGAGSSYQSMNRVAATGR